MVVESDDAVISDCFFTFSNKDYDEMSRKAELRKAGLLTFNGNETSAAKVDAEKILSKINQINANTSQETIETIIEGSLKEISKELSSTTNYTLENNDDEIRDEAKQGIKNAVKGKKSEKTVNFGVEVNFIENILQSLAEVVTMTVLSPKVYILLLINLKIIGKQTNFNLEGFIGQYQQLLTEIIRSIRDQILEYITAELMKIIGDIVEQLIHKLSIEQALYWQSFMKRLYDCFKYRRQKYNIDFNIDDVDYADILPNEEEPKNSEC